MRTLKQIYTNTAGEHADKVITPGTQMFVATMGGTGATLVVPFMFIG